MRCERCEGLMVVENCLDVLGGEEGFWIQAHRCIMCGNLEDSKIREHHISGPPVEIPIFSKKLRRAPRTPVARPAA